MVPTEKSSCQFVQHKKQSVMQMSRQCNELGGMYKSMRCEKHSEQPTNPGTCRRLKWIENDFNVQMNTWSNKHMGCHDLDRYVDGNGKCWCGVVNVLAAVDLSGEGTC